MVELVEFEPKDPADQGGAVVPVMFFFGGHVLQKSQKAHVVK